MPQQITRADEPAAIAKDTIRQHHRHLLDARIAYLFTDRASGGLAHSTKLTGVAHYLSAREDFAPYDFAILFSEPAWENLADPQKQALVDHELCHLGRIDGEWSILPHDVEEFAGVVERHGLWQKELEEFGASVMQLALPLEK